MGREEFCITFQVDSYSQARDELFKGIKEGSVELDPALIASFADMFSACVDLLQYLHNSVIELHGHEADGRTLILTKGDEMTVESFPHHEDH